MSEIFETVGKWFLPNTPDRQVAGTLSCKAERIELTLADSLRPMQSGPLRFDVVRYPVVHGVTRELEAFSLFRCTRIGTSLRFASGGSGQPETLWTHLAVEGAMLTEHQVYPELRCRIPGLQVWLSPNITQLVRDAKGFTFRVNKLPTETIAIPSIDAELDFDIDVSGAPGHSRTTIDTSGWLHVRPREPKLLSWFLEQLWKITSLLALMAEKPMPPDRIELKVDTHGFVLSVLVPRPSVQYCNHAQHHDFFVSRTRLNDSLSSIVEKWFELFARVEKPVDLALSTIASDELWPHVKFLSLLQALEGLHRALFPGHYMDATRYEVVRCTLVKAIPSSVGPDHRSSLQSRIQYGNEISLAKRLTELTELLPATLRTTILGSKAVPRSWVDTRNYYTHWDEALRSNVLSDQELYETSVRLTCLLQTLYLREAGVLAETLEAEPPPN
jgi:hypothetical protein